MILMTGDFASTADFPTGDVRTALGAHDTFLMKFNRNVYAAVTPTLGLVTTEAGGTASFTVRLGSAPTANVTIPVSSSDTTEGTASTASLIFTPDNWNVAQTVTVTGVDDTIFDGNVAYTIVLGPATSGDSNFDGLDPADVSVTNTDNDIPPTKFYVVNDATQDQTFEYSAGGALVETYSLNSGNTAPRGAASTTAGDTTWVVDANHKVYVYTTSGGLLGSWTAGTLASNATVEGIAVSGTDVWIVDAKSDKVYRYNGAASRLSGSQNATSSFSLNSGNTSPKDITTDGVNLWVVNDSTTDKVFKYTLSGSLVGSWTISTSGATSPRGITIDPSNVSNIWIVDRGTKLVYQYTAAAGRTSGSQAAAVSFALAPDNTNPQGIADPPASGSMAATQPRAISTSVSQASAMSASPAVSSAPQRAPADALFAVMASDGFASPTDWTGLLTSPAKSKPRSAVDLALLDLTAAV